MFQFIKDFFFNPNKFEPAARWLLAGLRGIGALVAAAVLDDKFALIPNTGIIHDVAYLVVISTAMHGVRVGARDTTPTEIAPGGNKPAIVAKELPPSGTGD